MQLTNGDGIFAEKKLIESRFLSRQITLDVFLPENIKDAAGLNLLLINDGQNLEEMNFKNTLEYLYGRQEVLPLLCVGIHAGPGRKMEYGVAAMPDYLGRGADAGLYTRFLIDELMPFIHEQYGISSFREKAIAGFSLGGLMALDIVLSQSAEFSKAGIFSGSFWWRSLNQYDERYDDELHRIMPVQIRNGSYPPGLKFFFQCGNLDETMDRNNNGIIDSIDDTLAVIHELKEKGYQQPKDIFYLEMPEGRHDLATWQQAMPVFLKWGWAIDPAVAGFSAALR